MIIHVVKLGGSLARTSRLPLWLDTIAEYGSGSTIVVPGGGELADKVRAMQQRLDFDDRTAHHMALLAMQQYGLAIKGMHSGYAPVYTIDGLAQVLQKGQVAVWMPDITVLDKAGITATWNVTSDSLSMWLANELSAKHLVIVKSLLCIQSNIQPEYLISNNIVDKAFFNIVRQPRFSLTILGRDDHLRYKNVIEGKAKDAEQSKRCELEIPQC